jgi:hypothetical protein
VVEVYLKFEGDNWADGDRSKPTTGYVMAGGAFPMTERAWEMTHDELTAIDGQLLAGTLRCDKVIQWPRHHDPLPADLVLRSVVMPWSETVEARIKHFSVLRRVPALAEW